MSDKFKKREEVNKSPDPHGETYQFTKLNLDDFIAWVDGPDGPEAVSPDGIVHLYLSYARPEQNWYVTPTRIYYSDVVHHVNTRSIEVSVDSGYGEYTKSILVSDLVDVDGNATQPVVLFFSETQKWVGKVESLLMERSGTIDRTTYRKIITDAVGK